jgi:competence ComEA-like helix-hairpin-helix protein
MARQRLGVRQSSGAFDRRANTQKAPEDWRTPKPGGASKSASILVALLWCLTLLSLIVIGMLHSARMDLTVQKNYGDHIQAHYLAIAGIEKAKALLYRDARDRSRISRNHTGQLYDSPEDFRDVTLGRGEFRVFHLAQADSGGGIVYGVQDEEARLNLNYASFYSLSNIDSMTPDIAAAIIDWRDEDDQVTPGGAEADYYRSLQPPYLPRNGPFQTVRDLLLVRGITRELLLGTTESQNDGSDDSSTNGVPESGWARIFTVDSSVDNLSAAGEERVNIQSADEQALTRITGITQEIARAIVAYRNQNRFESIANLLDVTAVQNRPGAQQNPVPAQEGQNQAFQSTDAAPNQQASNPSGPKVISPELLVQIGDEVTTQDGRAFPGAININTASLDVLMCLPGVTRQLAHAIISYRQANGYFPNIASLLNVQGFDSDLLKQVAALVSARSETFRILGEGRIKSSGTRARVQEIVHVGLRSLTTVSYREDDL